MLQPAASNARDFDLFVLDQVPDSTGGFFSGNYVDPKTIEYGWFSRRLAFFIAHFENESVLTDGTTAKGRAYKGLLTGLIKSDRSYKFESEWVRQVVTIDAQIQHDFGPREYPVGFVQMRRLLNDSYRVMFNSSSEPYSGSPPSSMRMNGVKPMMSTPEEERAHWVERFLWDSLHPVNRVYGDRREAMMPGTTLRVGQNLGNGVGETDVTFRFLKYIGEDFQGMQNDSLWKSDFSKKQSIQYKLSSMRTIKADSSIEFKKSIEQSFSVRLTVEYETRKQKWVPVIIIEHIDGQVGFKDAIVFGGSINVLAVRPSVTEEAGGTEYLRELSQNWWSWSNEGYSDTPLRERKSDKVQWRRFELDRPSLRTRARFSSSLPGELSGNQWAIKRKNSLQTKVVLRISNKFGGTSLDFGGLWGDRVYVGDLQFDIPDWSVEDLRQLIVNGIAPDHAIPE
ncbi:MAG: hypothetical protein P1U42_06245 [Phycisphaerales bacterium]|nr:hypothetical protein [Phycisphaerales bacterium]